MAMAKQLIRRRFRASPNQALEEYNPLPRHLTKYYYVYIQNERPNLILDLVLSDSLVYRFRNVLAGMSMQM
jgi:hypothetical protein